MTTLPCCPQQFFFDIRMDKLHKPMMGNWLSSQVLLFTWSACTNVGTELQVGISVIIASERIRRCMDIIFITLVNGFFHLSQKLNYYTMIYHHFQVWTTDPGRNSQLEYRLSIFYARVNDTGSYSCITPNQNLHTVRIIVKKVSIQSMLFLVKKNILY